MKQNVTFCDFQDAWRGHGRENSFSYEGLKLLFEWIEEFESIFILKRSVTRADNAKNGII